MNLQPAPPVVPKDEQETPLSVKAQGRLALSFKRQAQTTGIAQEHQSGCLRARLVRTGDAAPTITTINTAGGLTGGDRLAQDFTWQKGAEACVTSVAAEKIYRARTGGASIKTVLKLEAGSYAEWLPQEAILFDGGRIERDLEVHLASDATLIACEAMIFGRLARGEEVREGAFAEQIKLYQEGKLILFDRTKVEADLAQWLDRQAGGAQRRAHAMIVIVMPAPEEMRDDLREVLKNALGLAAVTLVRGLLHLRFLAHDDQVLRHDMALALSVARAGRPLPRNWSC